MAVGVCFLGGFGFLLSDGQKGLEPGAFWRTTPAILVLGFLRLLVASAPHR